LWTRVLKFSCIKRDRAPQNKKAVPFEQTASSSRTIAQEFAKIDLVEAEYWQQWEKSKLPKLVSRSEDFNREGRNFKTGHC
jgi:hypothetical protein